MMKPKSLKWVVAVLIVVLMLVPCVHAAESYEYVSQWGSYCMGPACPGGQFSHPNGIAVGPSGDIYVADTTNHRIQKFNPNGAFETTWGSSGSAVGEFFAPSGIAVDAAGNVYVADTGNSRIQKFTSDGTATVLTGVTTPYGVGVDASGNVYITGTYSDLIMKFTSAGAFERQWGIEGTGPGQFNEPVGVAVSGTSVYVVERANHRVQKFTSDGTYVTQWGSSGYGDGQFTYPGGIAVDSSGNVYVADSGYSRIQKFTSDGTYVTQWGSSGSGDGQFNVPQGVAVDPSSYVYVADTNNHRIQKFTPTGSIHVITNPDDAWIALDYSQVDELGGDTIEGIIPGPHDVTVWYDGYVPQTKSVTVTGGGTAEVSFTLAEVPPGPPSPGWKFHSDAENTGVYVDASGEYPANTVKWSFTTGGAVRSSPAVVDGVVYISSTDGKAYALDADTGAKIWEHQTSDTFPGRSSPAVANGVVYIGSTDRNVYALDADDGTEIWKYLTGAGNGIYSSPVVANGVVYVGTGEADSSVYALDAVTGTRIWSKKLGGSVLSSPAVAGGRVFVGCMDSKVYALNANTGETEWEFVTGDAIQSSPMVADGTVYIGSGAPDSKIYALDAAYGTKIWEFAASNSVVSTPALYGEWVIAGGGSNLYALNRDSGAQEWTYTASLLYSSPSVANGRVYIGASDNKVYALNADTGSEIWTYTTGNQILYSSPAITGGVLYIGSNDGKVYAFGGETIDPPQAAAIVIAAVFGPGGVPAGTSVFVSNEIFAPGTTLLLFPGLDPITTPDTCSAYAVITDPTPDGNQIHPVRVDYVCEGGTYIAGGWQPSLPRIPMSLVEGTAPDAVGLTPCQCVVNDVTNAFGTLAGASDSCLPNTNNNYALLISGGLDKEHNPTRYYNDIKFMYNALVNDYGYDPAKIRVLVSDGPTNSDPDKIDSYDATKQPVYGNSYPDLNGDQLPDVNYAATKANLIQAIADLGPLDGKDLFIFTTSHGASIGTPDVNNPNNNDVILYLWDDGSPDDDLYITDDDFVALLPQSAHSVTMMMEQCNGGGFINEFITGYTGNVPIRVIATAARGNEVSHSNDFSYPWISAAAGHDTASPPMITDADVAPVDTQVSMSEAFTYAWDRDASRRAGVETPQSASSAAGADAAQFLSPPCSPQYSILVTSPANNPTWSAGQTYPISWIYNGPSAGSATLKIELWKNHLQWGMLKQMDISKTVYTSQTSPQTFSWRIPASLPLGSGSGYIIKISTNSPTPSFSGQSGEFTISGVTTQRTGTMTIQSTPPGASIWINDKGAGTTDTSFTMPPLTFPVKVALSEYYPVGPTNVKVNQGLTTTKPFPLVAVETNDNAIRGLRHIVVESVPDEASVIINGADSGMVTHAEKDVAPGDYDIYVTKDGYKDSVTKHVTIPGIKQENARCSPLSVKVNFDLVPNTDVTATKTLIIPQPLNIARPDSYLLAFVTLPAGVKASDVVDGKVWCQDAPALKLYRLNTFPQTFAAVFRRGDLVGVSAGKSVPMKIWGVVMTSDGSAMFSAGTNVEVINKKNSPKEDIDNVLKWTALQVFKFFK